MFKKRNFAKSVCHIATDKTSHSIGCKEQSPATHESINVSLVGGKKQEV